MSHGKRFESFVKKEEEFKEEKIELKVKSSIEFFKLKRTSDKGKKFDKEKIFTSIARALKFQNFRVSLRRKNPQELRKKAKKIIKLINKLTLK